ncbi:uncharacterized protein LOC129962905 [Argiope bruennichi]|uniref:Chitin-binding type-2 domain-containing protein n=1 Tax=Argiope bruennichi TaxID=94029 RepID=A0A8T0EYT4_ARGBR|nr:uncharacterized protein LOC129962905 [Argiope bruennichi]KAF8782757.1 hypothetical protein HNY73_013002 [Argiope bruennichi]
MKQIVTFIVLSGLLCSATASRSKRAAYELPDGAELIVGPIRTTFVCSNEGYYADIDNNCQIFHICHTAVHADGTSEMQHWSFLCGNQTLFNQYSFTCTNFQDSIPCARSRDFFYLNANLHIGSDVPLHIDEDAANAASLTPGRSAQPPVAGPPAGSRLPFTG